MSSDHQKLIELAENGDVSAQRLLAESYLKTDVEQGIFWAKKAAAQNDVWAQFQLGLIYSEGRGVHKDLKTSRKYYEQSAAQGYCSALLNLGVLLIQQGEDDKRKGLKLIREAADQGNKNACYNLGHLYEVGKLVDQDYHESFSWFLLAAEMGEVESMRLVGYYYYEGMGTLHDMEQCLNWYEKAAQAGDMHARYRMGLFYATGEGVETDLQQAEKWFALAAEDGHQGAIDRLKNLNTG